MVAWGRRFDELHNMRIGYPRIGVVREHDYMGSTRGARQCHNLYYETVF